MLLTSNELFRLSQGHLNLLTACPRKFQHTYLEKLTTPTDPQQEEHQTLGSRFHLLMQQQEMGLPINSFLQVDSQLQTWITDFSNIAPEIFTPEINSQTFRESEHYRTLQIQDYLITVIYDLLIADHEKAQIFDWKTYPQPPDKNYLAKNWQTRLYMYVLAETSEYLPKHISMTYWFVQTKDENKKIQFNYNTRQHQQTGEKLNQILEDLTNWLEKYQQNQPFPQEPISKKSCEFCQYAVRCYNQTNNDLVKTSNILPNIANIQEVAF
jgi:CRISPR/Cas system-associated exonuclease Cas4 (RecB family)